VQQSRLRNPNRNGQFELDQKLWDYDDVPGNSTANPLAKAATNPIVRNDSMVSVTKVQVTPATMSRVTTTALQAALRRPTARLLASRVSAMAIVSKLTAR